MMARQTACRVYTAVQAFFNKSKQISPVYFRKGGSKEAKDRASGGVDGIRKNSSPCNVRKQLSWQFCTTISNSNNNWWSQSAYFEMDIGVKYPRSKLYCWRS